MKLIANYKLPRFFKWIVFDKETKEIKGTSAFRSAAHLIAKGLNDKAIAQGKEPVYQVINRNDVTIEENTND